MQSDGNYEDENVIIGFKENKLARKLISSIKTKCDVEGCTEEFSVSESENHWIACPKREYKCAICGSLYPNKQLFSDHILN